MKRQAFRRLLALACVICFVCGVAGAKEDPSKDRAKKLEKTTGTPFRQVLNVNNFMTWMAANGNGNNPPSQGGNGSAYPRGTRWPIFEDGVVWGAKAYLDAAHTIAAPNQVIRIGGGTYNVGNQAGAIIGSGPTAVPEDGNGALVRIFRIRRDYLEMTDEDYAKDAAEFNESTVDAVGSAEIDEIKAMYALDWAQWPVSKGAPYIERNGVAGYQAPPAFDYTTEGAEFTKDSLISGNYDEPGLAGADPNSPADQVMWTVANDLSASVMQAWAGSDPMGLEVQVTLWAYKRADALGQLYFKLVKIINKGGADVAGGAKGSLYLDSMYICQWSDPDLGNYSDDLVGCDSVTSIGFVYNGSAIDQEYAQFSIPPPSVGYDFLQGPAVPSVGDSAVFGLKIVHDKKNLPLTSFCYFSAGSGISDPPFTYEGGLRWWRMLQGYVPDPSTATWRLYPHPTGEVETFYPLSGDPTTRTGFIDGLGEDWSYVAGDRRIVLNSGPFQLAPGDTQEIVVGTVGGLGADRLSSVSVMKFNDRFVQNTYNAIFQVPQAPAAPKVTYAELDGRVVFEWASDPAAVAKTEQTVNNPGGYTFEGYNVYQFPSASGTLANATRITTFDLPSDPTVVLDEQFDTKSGQVLSLPVQYGTNSGIVRYFELTQDYVQDIAKLYNGQEYYVAITAYSIATVPGYLPAVLESAPQVLTVRPRIVYGTTVPAGTGDTVAVTHTTGISDGEVVPIVIDPLKITGDSYSVTFAADPADPTATLWSLKNTTKNTTVLADQTNQSGDEDYTIVDGLLLKAVGPPVAINRYTFSPSADRWFTGVNWGGAQFFGGLDIGYNFFGSSITPDQYVTVEVRFKASTANGQNAYMYLRGGTPSYGYVSYTPQHFTVWDVTSVPERQIAAAYVEQAGSAANNNLWQPTASNADREYLFIFNTDYTATPDAFYTSRNASSQADEFPTLYAMWPLQRGTMPFNPQDNQVFRITPNFANTTADAFTFNTATYAPVKSAALEKASVEDVNVFPNPYYAFNAAETNRLVRFVTFSNLPPKVKIRIFNLAGQLVRVLDKDDNSQFLRWDLANQDNFPIASGMYLAYVEMTMPTDGSTMSKVLKVAIIQEQEILNVY